VSASGTTAADEPEKEREKVKPRELTAMVDLPSREVHYGGLMIAAGDTVVGNVVVIKGSLDIQSGGVLKGDAWVINGNLILTGTAAIEPESGQDKTRLQTGQADEGRLRGHPPGIHA